MNVFQSLVKCARNFFTYKLLLLFSCSVVSDSLQLLGMKHPGFPVLHYRTEFAQTNVHGVHDAIQSFHPLSPSSPHAIYLFQHQALFQQVGSLHQVAKVLEFQEDYFKNVFLKQREYSGWSPIN